MLCSFLLGVVVILNIGIMRSSENNIRGNQLERIQSDFEMKRWRRSSATVDSCGQSPIQLNMTLKGGIEAGYFRKLAQHVAMKLCIELCCEEKGCDVAFMSGKNCYGVQCFNEELCRALPAKKNVTEPVMIAHVTFKGERVKEKEDINQLQCTASRRESGVTLHGGLHAGNFTDVGTVGNLSMCVELCCMSKQCDLALMINYNCFIVSCHSVSLCTMKKSFTASYKPSLAYVNRKHVKNNATAPQIIETSANQLVCKNSQIFHNTTLKGGYRAGNYTNFGKVANISACVRLCCGNKDCDAALMLENNCFAVACRDSDNCLPVHAKSSSSLAALNPRISYITSRSEEVSLAGQLTTDGSCHAGIVSYDVSLKGGASAGNFTPHGKVGSMEVCISKCCQIDGCSVAMMLKDTCFTVVCSHDVLCEKKQTPTSSDFNPKIAYVFRDKKKTVIYKVQPAIHKNTKMKAKKKWLLEAQLHAITSSQPTQPQVRASPRWKNLQSNSPLLLMTKPKCINVSRPIAHINNTKTSFRNTIVINDTFSNNTVNTSAFMNNTLEAIILHNFLTNNDHYDDDSTQTVERSQYCVSPACTNVSTASNDSEIEMPSKNFTKSRSMLNSVDGDPGCTNSEVFHNVTLRGGMHSGKFKDRGEMEDVDQCVKLCCLLDRCDLAFMLKNTCFSVECYNETVCDAIPAKSSIFSPSICYVYVKISTNGT